MSTPFGSKAFSELDSQDSNTFSPLQSDPGSHLSRDLKD